MLYERLKNCGTREEVREVCLAAFGLSFPAREKTDGTRQVLYVFRKEKKFSAPHAAARVLAQALYALRELKYGEATCPVPPFVCAVCREEALLAPTRPFSAFYARHKEEKYDWDRTPLSPCPQLVSDLEQSRAFGQVRVYSLEGEEESFFAALGSARAVQLSVFGREKKAIDENNFLKVYEYWASLFGEALGGKADKGRLPEYFLADIEGGRSAVRGGRVEFLLSGSRVTRSLPLYEYNYFWSIYAKVKDERAVFAIRRKMDRLSEDLARRFEGEFYTPIPFAAKAYEYLEKTIGKKKLESGAYRIWDMAAGSGNLEFTLPAAALPYTYISTLDGEDAAYCRRIFPSATVFQYDYLNDDADFLERKLFREEDGRVQLSLLGELEGSGKSGGSGEKGDENPETKGAGLRSPQFWEEEAGKRTKMPESLRRDLADPRIRWLIFLNPPFATGNSSSLEAGKASKSGVADTAVRRLMAERGYGETSRELFSQFLFRISEEFRGRKGYLGLFSTLKYLNAPNDRRLRDGFFRYAPERGFLFSSENFEGGTGKFPVGFVVWNLEKTAPSGDPVSLDVFDRDAEKVGYKEIKRSGRPLSEWVKRPPAKYLFPPFTGAERVCEGHADVRDRVAEGFLCSLMCCGNDMQHRNQTALFSGPQASAGAYSVTAENFERSMAVHAVRRLPPPDWTNNRDQFYAPSREPDGTFFADCAVWSAFAPSNNTCSMKDVAYRGEIFRVRNQLFPYSQLEANGWSGREIADPEEGESFLFSWLKERELSEEAKRVLRAGRVFYAYCFGRGYADMWDVGFARLKASVSSDERGREALNALKAAHKALGEKLLPEVYGYGFLPPAAVYFGEE